MNEIKYIRAEDRETEIDFLSILAVRKEIERQHSIENKESITPENFIGVTITHTPLMTQNYPSL